MRCEEIKELLSPYLENDLSTEEKESVSEHLGDCQSCKKELEGLKEMLLSLKKIPAIEPPPYFLEAVRMRLERSSILVRILRKIFVPVHIKVPVEALGVTATVVLIFFLLQTYMRRGFEGRLRSSVDEVGVNEQFELAKILSQQTVTQVQRRTEEQLPYEESISQYKGIEFANQFSRTGGFKEKTASPVLEKFQGQIPASSLPVISGDKNIEITNRLDTTNRLNWTRPVNAAVGKDYNNRLFLKEAIPPDLISLPRTQIILKTKNLEEDIPKLQIILKDLAITNIKQENYPDKVLFNFSIFHLQLEPLLSNLKDWQKISFPQATLSKKEDRLNPLLIELILTIQETP